MSALEIMAVIVAVLVLLAVGGAVANKRRRTPRPQLEARMDEVNRALAAAFAADRGWEPDELAAAAARAFEAERPGVQVREQSLVAVVDRAGTDLDEAVFRFVAADGTEARLRLGRAGGEWVSRGIEG